LSTQSDKMPSPPPTPPRRPATGDQGADLIAKKNGRTIIIQAKCYQGTVGNKAVQEVISALAYYGGDEGWVVTNSFFTPSAKALAHPSFCSLRWWPKEQRQTDMAKARQA
jgi:Restriction endonuclease